MTRRRAWALVAGILVIVLAAPVVWLFTADLGVLQGQILSFASEKLGRRISVEQSLSIRVGGQVRIEARGLQVGNPDWASRPNLLEVDRLLVSVRLRSLWRGPIDVTVLEAGGLRFWPEADADGRSNLAFPGSQPPPTPDKVGKPVQLPIFRQVSLQDLAMLWSDARREQPLDLRIANLSQELGANGLLELQLSGQANGREIKYQGSLGDVEALLQGRGIRYQGAGQLGRVRFRGEGTIDDLKAPRHPELDLELSGDDIEPVANLLGRTAPSHESFSIHARSTPRDGGQTTSLDAKVGDFTLDADGSSSALTDFSEAAFDVKAQGGDLGAFTEFLGLGRWPHDAFSFEGHLDRRGGALSIRDSQLEIGATRFELSARLPSFPQWRDGTGSLDISGPDVAAFRALLGFEGRAEGAFSVHAELSTGAGGAPRIEASAHTSLIDLSLDGSPGQNWQLDGSSFQATMSGEDAGILLRGYGVPGFANAPFVLTLNAGIQDKTLRLDRGTQFELAGDVLEGSGTVAFPPLAGGTRLQLAVRGSDLSRYAPVLKNMSALPGQAFDLRGGLALEKQSLQLDAVKGTVGDNHLEADGRIALRRDLRGTRLKMSARGDNLETLIADTPTLDVPAQPFDVSGDLAWTADTFVVKEFVGDVGPLQARADVSLSLPLSGSSGSFDLKLHGPDPNLMWPKVWSFQPAALPFDVLVQGSATHGVWAFDQAQLSFGDARMGFTGQLDQFPDFSATALEVRAQVPDASALGAFKGEALPSRPLDLSARLSGTRNRFRVDNVTLGSGASDLSGAMFFDFESTVPVVQWRSHSTLLDYESNAAREAELAEARDQQAALVKDTDAAVTPDGKDSGLPFPDTPLPLEMLRKANVRIDVGIDTLRLPRRTYTNVALELDLTDGALKVNKLRGEGLRGYYDATLSVVPRPDGAADLALDVEADGLVLNLSRDRASASEDLPVIEYAIHITSQGRSLHEVAAGLNGTIWATASPGIIPNSLLAAIDAGLLEQLFNAILPGRVTEPTTRLECMAARLGIENGLVSTEPAIALVSDKVQMVSAGNIDLATGKLDLSFENHPNRRYQTNMTELLVNPFVKISGTLAHPKMTLDAPKALVYSGIAWGTGGLSILAKGLWDRLTRSPSPCEQFVKEAKTGKK